MDAVALKLPERTPVQTLAFQESVGYAPAGAWMLKHLDDGPYWLATVRDTHEEEHQQATPYLNSALMFEVPLVDIDTDPEMVNVYLLTDLGYNTVSWYTGGEDQIWLDQIRSSGPFVDLPTTKDLALHFARLLQQEPDSKLAHVLMNHQDKATSSLPTLLRELSLNVTDKDELATLLETLLRNLSK